MDILKASDVKTMTSIRAIIDELMTEHRPFVELVAERKNWAVGDAAEAIATHIFYTDSDYTI